MIWHYVIQRGKTGLWYVNAWEDDGRYEGVGNACHRFQWVARKRAAADYLRIRGLYPHD